MQKRKLHRRTQTVESSSLHPEVTAAFSLAGRVAVITGAGSGIGRGTARVLAQTGAQTVIADVNETGLAETADLVTDCSGVPMVRRTDVPYRADVDALADDVLALMGRLDIWVNSAGIIVSSPIVEATEAQIDRMIAVNLKGVYAGCAAAGRAMMPTATGSIINLSSAGGESPAPALSIYAMTKAGVNALTRSAAAEFGRHGIRANAVAAGWVDTPMGLHSVLDEFGNIAPEDRAAFIQKRAQISPLGIAGTPRDIALAILYLASDASRFVTGQIIRPNGGIAMP